MKIIGIVFLFFVFAFLGFYRAYLYFLNLQEIQNCKKMLDYILLYIESGRLSVKEIFENIDKCGSKSLKKLSEKIMYCLYENRDITSEEIKDTFCKDSVTSEILSGVLMFLGKCSATEQIQKIEIGIKNINQRYNEIFIEYKQKAKLASSMGIIMGFFVIIILI